MTTSEPQPRQQPSLKCNFFRMRPIEVGDAETVAGWYQQIDDVSIFDRLVPLPLNQTDVTSLVKSLVIDQEKEKCRWFITENDAAKPIGMVGLEAINLLHGHAILPLFIEQDWRRSGIGIRMACMMVDLAFKQLRLHRIGTFYRADNISSKALLDRMGFKQEGISRQSWFSRGQYFDQMNVGLLLNDWKPARKALQTELNPNIKLGLGPRTSPEWSWPGKS